MQTMAAQAAATATAQAASATAEPSPTETAEPTEEPTQEPTVEPTAEPTEEPTEQPTEQPTTAPSGERTHIVQPGENLFRIALRYGMNYLDLAAYNNIVNPHNIQAGQVIRIPATAPSTPPQPPAGGETIHVVQPGENLFRIALRYNMSHHYLASYNGISNPNAIYVGQQIRIPPR
jgi:LysM repeat protein